MRIAFITEDFAPWEGKLTPGGCAYYRQMLPMNAAGPGAAFGRPAWSGELGFGVVLENGKAHMGFDTVVMKMMMARWTPTQMKAAQGLGQRLIVDMDDHYDALHPANNAYITTDPARNKIHNRDYLRQVIELADVVTCSTPELYDYYKPIARDVRLIRNGINPHQFQVRKHRNRRPVVGWVGAIRWRANDVETCRPWLNDFLTEHDLMFHHAGHMPDTAPFHEIAGIDRKRMIYTPMEPLHTYHVMLRGFDIGLVLLEDIPFNRAKSTIKGLEYAAAGVPFVAQALPEYTLLAEQGVGRVASTPEQWHEQLSGLLDYRDRRKEADRNLTLAMQHHSIQQRAHEWVALFEEGKDIHVPVPTMEVIYREHE